MKRITIIGNIGSKINPSDGGRIKVCLYRDILSKNNFDVQTVNLDNWKKHLLSVIISIYKKMKDSDIVLIMAGPRGCRKVIPLINFLNKKFKKRIVYCPVGIGTLDYLLKKHNVINLIEMEKMIDRHLIRDDKMKSELKKVDSIIVENDYLKKVYFKIYDLDNIHVLTNFRDVEIEHKIYKKHNTLEIVFASRVCFEKGIFDLLNAIDNITKNTTVSIHLDIYGEIQLNEEELRYFNGFILGNPHITYKGIINQCDIIKTLKKYDLFVLPTKYYGEGTPGILVESLISGTPALISDYSQARNLITENYNGYLYKFNDCADLRDKILEICARKDSMILNVLPGIQESAKKYLFKYNKDNFFNFIVGKELEK